MTDLLKKPQSTLTDNVQKAQLTFHRVCVDLAHVPSFVGLPHLLDVYVPRPVIRVRHADPMIFRDHVVVDGQYGLRVNTQPGHLKEQKNKYTNKINK